MMSDAMATLLPQPQPTNGIRPPQPKQIRFVTNQGQPPSKRRRVNAACLTCRKRKTRCAGEKPICSTCSKNGHLCLGYPEIPEKKKEDKGPANVKSDPDESVDADYGMEDDFAEQEEEDENRTWRAAETSNCTTFLNDDSSRRESASSVSGRPATNKRPSNEWETPDIRPQLRKPSQRPTFPRNSSSYTEDGRNSSSRSPLQHQAESNRVPYFRYFGPTAIVPGFKQMVVDVRGRRKSRGGSFSATSPGSASAHGLPYSHQSQTETILESLEDVPVYDQNDPAPVHPMIISLVKTFFLHLGSNYQFLKEEKFLRMIREKRVEPILVDAICALASRFSEPAIVGNESEGRVIRSEFGHIFAQRAKSGTVDTFPAPSVGAVQAFLIMAYEGFAADQDSALWMYLGLAIRMAVDVGLPRVEGVTYQGEKDPWYTRNWSRKGGDDEPETNPGSDYDLLSREEQKEVEQERIDTFWAVFMLDRVIASGTGRPVTFRDDDFEFGLPDPTVDPVSGWPAPLPTFIRIIHLYGRVSDVLNRTKTADDLTPDKLNRLVQMESDLTKIYQEQDPRLNFTVPNFQEYVKAGQGGTFILLHCWFHALIIVLHQPTLLFGHTSKIHQLLPNSRELSMSSAKTIADILAFAELIDPMSYIGNPFTSQPMYIAACAFLVESLANASQPPSPDTSPPADIKIEFTPANASKSKGPADARLAKHSLLASAANQNYQRCYKSLQQLHTYWGGVKYILTVLDQRSKGNWDCETYTFEEYESTKIIRKGARLPQFRRENPASPNVPPIAWSLTGTTNSPNTNLTVLYQNKDVTSQPPPPVPPLPPHPSASVPRTVDSASDNRSFAPIRHAPSAMFATAYPQANVSHIRNSNDPPKQRRSASYVNRSQPPGKMLHQFEAVPVETHEHSRPGNDPNEFHMMASMPQPNQAQPAHSFTPSPQQSSGYEPSIMPEASPASSLADPGPSHHHQHQRQSNVNASHGGPGPGGASYPSEFPQSGLVSGSYQYMGATETITFDSQDIDIGGLALPSEMVAAPWLEYLPGDLLGIFPGSNGGMAGGMNGSPQQGPGPGHGHGHGHMG